MTTTDELMVVLEYCEYGALQSYLQKNDVPEDHRLLLAGDCAEGLAYIASLGFVHRGMSSEREKKKEEKKKAKKEKKD